MANDLTVSGNGADGNLPTVPSWALAATTDTWPGEWDTGAALRRLGQPCIDQLPAAAEIAKARCAPIDPQLLKQRLTALGMTLAPNRPAAEATMWLHETGRLLSDISGDVLSGAIDTLQKRLKFLPTVAEIREIADPEMERRRREYARIDAMCRYTANGLPIPTPQRKNKPLMERRGEPMSEAETTELNRQLESLGAKARYRADGSRYFPS